MKKIFGIVAMLLLVLSLTACGNMNLGLGGYEYNYLYVQNGDGSYTEYEVESWLDYDDATVEVKTKDGNNLLLHNSFVILSKDRIDKLVRK